MKVNFSATIEIQSIPVKGPAVPNYKMTDEIYDEVVNKVVEQVASVLQQLNYVYRYLSFEIESLDYEGYYSCIGSVDLIFNNSEIKLTKVSFSQAGVKKIQDSLIKLVEQKIKPLRKKLPKVDFFIEIENWEILR